MWRRRRRRWCRMAVVLCESVFSAACHAHLSSKCLLWLIGQIFKWAWKSLTRARKKKRRRITFSPDLSSIVCTSFAISCASLQRSTSYFLLTWKDGRTDGSGFKGVSRSKITTTKKERTMLRACMRQRRPLARISSSSSSTAGATISLFRNVHSVRRHSLGRLSTPPRTDPTPLQYRHPPRHSFSCPFLDSTLVLVCYAVVQQDSSSAGKPSKDSIHHPLVVLCCVR